MIRYIYALIALALIWLAGCMSQPRPSYEGLEFPPVKLTGARIESSNVGLWYRAANADEIERLDAALATNPYIQYDPIESEDGVIDYDYIAGDDYYDIDAKLSKDGLLHLRLESKTRALEHAEINKIFDALGDGKQVSMAGVAHYYHNSADLASEMNAYRDELLRRGIFRASECMSDNATSWSCRTFTDTHVYIFAAQNHPDGSDKSDSFVTYQGVVS